MGALRRGKRGGKRGKRGRGEGEEGRVVGEEGESRKREEGEEG